MRQGTNCFGQINCQRPRRKVGQDVVRMSTVVERRDDEPGSFQLLGVCLLPSRYNPWGTVRCTFSVVVYFVGSPSGPCADTSPY